MKMSEELEKLKELQEVLAEKYDFESKVEELPKSLEGSTVSLEKFKQDFIAKNSEYEAKKAVVASIKEQLEQALKDREAGEKGMDSISTHREYEMLDKQINEAQERENNLRKELLREEKILADMNDSLKSDEELITSTEKEVEESKANLSQEISSLNSKIASLTKKEKEMSEGIDPETIIKFQRIIKRNHEGIVAVRGNVCSGCHMILPSQFANEVHRGEKILFCPYCSRILFYEESDEEDYSYLSMEEAGSLADLDDEELFAEEAEALDGEEADEVSSDMGQGDYNE